MSRDYASVYHLLLFTATTGFSAGSDGRESSAMWETQVRPLGEEDPLEEGMATYSSIFAWSNPWTEEPGGLRSIGSQSRTPLSDLACIKFRITE